MISQTPLTLCTALLSGPRLSPTPRGSPAWDSVFKNKTWPPKASLVFLQPVRGDSGEAGGSYPELSSSRGRLSRGLDPLCGPLHTETEMRAFKGKGAQHMHPQTDCREAAVNKSGFFLAAAAPMSNYHALNIVSVNGGQ